MLADLRLALRAFAKAPGFTAVAVLSLACAIGANTAVFSLVNSILLGSLPVPNPHELRTLRWSGTDFRRFNIRGHISSPNGTASGTLTFSTNPGERMSVDAFTYPLYRSLRERGAAQAEIAGYTELYGINARAHNEAFSAEGLMVSDNFFSALGVRPVIGRLFAEGDDRAGTAPLVVVSYGWWERQFDFAPDVLGQTVMLNGHAFTVVGVLPREFRGMGLADRREFYVPMSAQPLLMANRPTSATDRWWVHLLARLHRGVSEAQWQAGLEAAFAGQVADVMKAPKIEITDGRAGPAYDQGRYREPLMILLSVVGIVILVACANLTGLSLARGAARQHEFAVRAALGAGRWRLIRQSLTESLVLALTGGVLGVVIALWGQAALSRLFAGTPEGLHYDLRLDFTVLGYTFSLALATALLSGLMPALRAGRVDPLTGLKSRTALGAPRLRTGRILVTAQIALSVLLLAGAGLYVRTLVNLLRINPGFSTDHRLLFYLAPHAAGIRGPATTAFFDRSIEALERVPGIRAAALTEHALLGDSMTGGGFFTLPTHPEFSGEKKPQAHRLDISEGFFATMGISLRLGRGLTAADTAAAPKVVVVNETFVRRFFGREHPLGQILKTGNEEWSVVGVCSDVKYTDLKKEIPPTVYFSYRQTGITRAYVVVRTSLPPLAVVAAARKAVATVDANVPLSDITTQEAIRDQQLSHERMFATLVGALGGLAMLLAGIGLYGLLAYNVARRTPEFGIRAALGATPGDVSRPIVRDALLLAVIGLAIGVPVAIASAQLIKDQLYGVPPHDPLVFVVGAIVLLATAPLVAWFPARRAAQVDPMIALRAE